MSLNKGGHKLASSSVSNLSILLEIQPHRLVLKSALENIAVIDEKSKREEFRQIFGTEGAQMINFSIQTFSSDINEYPGYDAIIHILS